MDRGWRRQGGEPQWEGLVGQFCWISRTTELIWRVWLNGIGWRLWEDGYGWIWTRLKRAWDAIANTRFEVSSLGREISWSLAGCQIRFRKITPGNRVEAEWEGSLRRPPKGRGCWMEGWFSRSLLQKLTAWLMVGSVWGQDRAQWFCCWSYSWRYLGSF